MLFSRYKWYAAVASVALNAVACSVYSVEMTGDAGGGGSQGDGGTVVHKIDGGHEPGVGSGGGTSDGGMPDVATPLGIATSCAASGEPTCPAGYSTLSVIRAETSCSANACSLEAVCYGADVISPSGGCDPCVNGLSEVTELPTCDCPSGAYYVCAS